VDVVNRPFDLTYRLLGIPLPAFGQVRRYTPHGPVIVWDPKHRLALAARWSAFEDDRVTMRRLVGLERSRTAAELAERHRSLVTPTINLVAADIEGATLYQAVGLVPRRGFAPGPGVLPGDGRHEWTGFIPPDSMPAWRPGPGGFAVNGNNRPAHARSADAWPRYDWPHDRAARMHQRLAGDRSVTLADLVSVQNDVHSRAGARQVPALLAAIAPREATLPARTRVVLDSLRGWDFVARRDRVGPTIARAWWNAWVRRGKFEGVPGLALASLTGEAGDTLRSPAGAVESVAEGAAGALTTAIDTLAAKLGPDPARWTWGRAHLAHFHSALTAHGRGSTFEPALVPADGDGSTVSVGGSSAPWAFTFTHGPAFRHVVDLADSLTSWVVIPPWNSAASGAHSADLRARWADHGYVPLRMDWTRIERDSSTTVAFPAGNRP
jgi:penicillin amidase